MSRTGRPVIRNYPQRLLRIKLPETVYRWLKERPEPARAVILAALCQTYEACPGPHTPA